MPRKRTQVKLPNGVNTIKSRDYLCVLVWVFWDGDPIKQENKQDTSGFKDMIDKLKDTVINQESKVDVEENNAIHVYSDFDQVKEVTGIDLSGTGSLLTVDEK